MNSHMPTSNNNNERRNTVQNSIYPNLPIKDVPLLWCVCGCTRVWVYACVRVCVCYVDDKDEMRSRSEGCPRRRSRASSGLSTRPPPLPLPPRSPPRFPPRSPPVLSWRTRDTAMRIATGMTKSIDTAFDIVSVMSPTTAKEPPTPPSTPPPTHPSAAPPSALPPPPWTAESSACRAWSIVTVGSCSLATSWIMPVARWKSFTLLTRRLIIRLWYTTPFSTCAPVEITFREILVANSARRPRGTP
jgi:hypothetical protein